MREGCNKRAAIEGILSILRNLSSKPDVELVNLTRNAPTWPRVLTELLLPLDHNTNTKTRCVYPG